MKLNKIIVFPGTFNPFHEGHLEIISKINKKYFVLILISNNPNKKLVSFQKRYKQITKFLDSYKHKNKIIFGINFNLTVDFLNILNIKYILRGFRNSYDKKYEINLFNEYKKSKKNLKFKLIRSKKNIKLSSSFLRDEN